MTRIVETIEINVGSRDSDPSNTSRRVQITSILAIVTALGMMALGMLFRNNNLNAVVEYNDDQNGIRALLPANWLLTTNNPEFIFRAEDPKARPFKTQILVSVQAVGPDATPRNVADLLSIQRQRLTAYGEFSRTEIKLGEDDAFQIDYTYTETETNPFLEALPIVVRGVDVVVLRGNQAVIFTFRDASFTFDANYYHFERFLASVEY